MTDPFEEMRSVFGDAHTDEHIVRLKAARALKRVFTAYIRAEANSPIEDQAEATLTNMMTSMKNYPEKSVDMVETLLAYVYHLENGGTEEQFFNGIDF